jgi:hypothetical protein
MERGRGAGTKRMLLLRYQVFLQDLLSTGGVFTLSRSGSETLTTSVSFRAAYIQQTILEPITHILHAYSQ